MPGIGVITNPRSRMNKRNPAAMRKLGYLIGSRGAAAATTSLDDLYRVAEEFKSADIDILGINGGDGTIHHTLTAFLKVYEDKPLPLVAFLRGGTLNTIATSYGIFGHPEALLFELVDKYHNHDPFDVFEHAVLKVGDAYGFIFGNGVIYNFLKAYYGTGRPSVAMGAQLLLATIGSACVGGELGRRITARFHGRVTVDGTAWAEEDFIALAAGCCEQIGLGFKPFHRWREPDGFPLLGIHVRSPLGLIAELPRVHAGRPMRRHKVIDQLAREVTIEADEVRYTIDGDTYERRHELRLALGPRLRFIRLTGQPVSDALEPEARAALLGARTDVVG